MKHHIAATVLVFDTSTNRIGIAYPLLDKSSWPMAAILDDTIYCLGRWTPLVGRPIGLNKLELAARGTSIGPARPLQLCKLLMY
jgi:hypothetical protein